MLVPRPILTRRYLALAWGVVLLVLETGLADNPRDYSPVAPTEALQFALKANLKVVVHWLDEKDYVSAEEATSGLATLAQLFRYQSNEPAWRGKAQILQDKAGVIADAARRKSAADANKAVKDWASLLEDLAKDVPRPTPIPDLEFKSFGATKTWMTLMEGAYRDAQRAETAKEIELLAFSIAAEANVVGRLRSESAWRKSTQEVIELALQAARQARDAGLEPSRKTLKTMYQRCEACHNRTQK